VITKVAAGENSLGAIFFIQLKIIFANKKGFKEKYRRYYIGNLIRGSKHK
jgi:hypothetical protein